MDKKEEISIDSKCIIIAKPCGFLQKESDNWGILYNNITDFSFAVNPMGIFIWELLKEKISVDMIRQKVAAHFTNIPDEVEEDIIQFIQKLIEIDLVEITKN